MGMAVLLPAVVAMIVGGVSRLEGVAVGAIILGVLENVAVWHWSARWEPLVTFTLLIGFLLLRPRGLFQNGRRVEQQ
jgi:branched-chain amino acid transport system permease protein